LWFDPAGTEPAQGDLVVVKTERGEELGQVQQSPFDLDDPTFDKGLKPVLRIANDRDLNYQLELGEKEKEALPIFWELIEKHELSMRPVDIEYLISGDKIVFYFSAEERVDFRDLVHDLATHFQARIDMRQVGVRDEARMIGGLSHCGQTLCCARLGGEFAPVSIKMAKDQGLPLNPTKISGLCGRLMCCLRYEVGAYRDFNSRAPRKGSSVEVSDGRRARVGDLDAVRELVSLRFARDDMPDETVTVKLCDLCCEKSDKGDKRCSCSIDAEVLDELQRSAQEQRNSFAVGNARFLTDAHKPEAGDAFSPTQPDAGTKTSSRGGGAGAGAGGERRRRRSRGKGGPSTGAGEKAPAQSAQAGQAGGKQAGAGQSSGEGSAKEGAQRSRRRRSGSRSRSGSSQAQTQAQNQNQGQGRATSAAAAPVDDRVPRRRRR